MHVNHTITTTRTLFGIGQLRKDERDVARVDARSLPSARAGRSRTEFGRPQRNGWLNSLRGRFLARRWRLQPAYAMPCAMPHQVRR